MGRQLCNPGGADREGHHRCVRARWVLLERGWRSSRSSRNSRPVHLGTDDSCCACRRLLALGSIRGVARNAAIHIEPSRERRLSTALEAVGLVAGQKSSQGVAGRPVCETQRRPASPGALITNRRRDAKSMRGLLPIEWVILRTICEEAGVKQLVFRGEPRRPGDRVDARTASSEMRNVSNAPCDSSRPRTRAAYRRVERQHFWKREMN